ncbi:uncharacterized protein LOC110421077 [Herrania umbratica]|uniref:Uncharacterized protein LOC110421077 n=1 Tax=Herrania umbratica TaxID=108875 RepID=A0A6J1AUV6_9ROSI|nr:uncharacterized protein LOC110421077 [Herrania umbratica]
MMSIPSPSHMGTPPHMGTSPHTDSAPHMDSPPHLDIHQELFPDYYGGPASIPSEAKEESLGNDIPNGSNDCAPGVKENNFHVPVQPCTGGEGLPYAPIDWPNPGDIWSWRVGKRVSSSGFYNDRFLTVPKRLRKPNNPKVFASKPTLERFLRSQFPDADIDAFFASFIWKIPAILESPAKADTLPPAIGVEDGEKESNKKTRRSSQRKTPRSGHSNNSKKRQKTTTESVRPRRQTRQHLKNSAPAPSENEETNAGLDMSFLDDEKTREEFDTYLNSLDDMLAQPLCEEPFTHPLMPNSFPAEDEMSEARGKLSSFLDMDFPSLICFKDLDELTSLASKLRKDPTLTAEQLVKLKLIEEIPSFCEVFLENRDVMEQADKFFTALEDNKAKVTSLRQEYSELKEQVTHLQSEVDSNTLTVQEIDNQIAQLKSRRAELTRTIENKKRDRDDLTYNQKLVANSIPKVVHEVQLANARKPGWELKKENAERREAEILAKFAPLKGFSL